MGKMCYRGLTGVSEDIPDVSINCSFVSAPILPSVKGLLMRESGEHGEPWELSSQVDHKAHPAAMSEPLCLPPSETGYQHPWSHRWLRNGDLRATWAFWFPVLYRSLNYFLLQLWLGRQLTHVSPIFCFHCFSGICIKGCVKAWRGRTSSPEFMCVRVGGKRTCLG